VRRQREFSREIIRDKKASFSRDSISKKGQKESINKRENRKKLGCSER
jgi:hypothetical protein